MALKWLINGEIRKVFLWRGKCYHLGGDTIKSGGRSGPERANLAEGPK
jgi:hypothetical protein